MTTPTHIAVGYFIARGFAHGGILPDTNSTYLLSMMFANAPDIDALFIYRPLYSHRDNMYSLSHYPISWLALWCVVYLIFWTLSPNFLGYIIMCGISISSHFILDSIDIFEGIAWLGPWIKTKFSILSLVSPLPSADTSWSTLYLIYRTHWAFYAEIVVCLAAFIVAFIS